VHCGHRFISVHKRGRLLHKGLRSGDNDSHGLSCAGEIKPATRRRGSRGRDRMQTEYPQIGARK
jgi:hypothetical protein